MALRAALLGSRASCSQPFASPACLGSGRAPRGRVAARPAGRGPARCVRTRAAQAEVSTEKDVAAISDALRQAIAAEDYPLAARLRDELQRLPEVELESQLRVAVEQEDYAVRPPSRLAAPLCTARGRVQCQGMLAAGPCLHCILAQSSRLFCAAPSAALASVAAAAADPPCCADAHPKSLVACASRLQGPAPGTGCDGGKARLPQLPHLEGDPYVS